MKLSAHSGVVNLSPERSSLSADVRPQLNARVMTRLRVLLSVLFAATPGLRGQGPPPPSWGKPRTLIIPGVHFQTVQGFSGSLQVLRETWTGPEGGGGYQVGLDLGRGGAKLRLGRGAVSAFGGGSECITVLRTWGNPGRVEPHQTFVGPEVRVVLFVIAVGVGYYWRVSGSAPGHGQVLNLSVGLLY